MTQSYPSNAKSGRSAAKRESADNTNNIAAKKHSSSSSSMDRPSGGSSFLDPSVASREDPPASSSPSGASAFIQAYRYSNRESPPYIVQVQSSSDSLFPHPLHISRTLSQIFPREITEVKKVGKGKVHVFLKSFEAANKMILNTTLVDHNLKAFIPLHRILRTGIIRDIPQDFTLEALKEEISSPIEILEIYRLNRRVKCGNEFQYIPSRTICIKFAGQSLPSYIGLYSFRYPVFPFIPKARICFACFRIEHLSKACKSNPRCLFCRNPGHDSSTDCPNKSLPAKCINCGGAHFSCHIS